jgi:hypothetical protein
MANNKNKSSPIGILIALIIGAIFLFSWIHIPGEIDPITGIKKLNQTDITSEILETPDVTELQALSFAFADGFLVGWADELAVKIFYSESEEMEKTASAAFREAAIIGEDKYPVGTMLFLLIGSILSIGAIIAVQIARSADNVNQAFKLGFFTEIAESVAYHTGYYSTMQKSALSTEEVVITLVVAFITGFAATFAFKNFHK